jgi:hypothetical protein
MVVHRETHPNVSFFLKDLGVYRMDLKATLAFAYE